MASYWLQGKIMFQAKMSRLLSSCQVVNQNEVRYTPSSLGGMKHLGCTEELWWERSELAGIRSASNGV